MYKILSVLKVCTIPAKKAHFVGSFSKASDWLQSFKKKIQTFLKSCCKVYHSLIPLEKRVFCYQLHVFFSDYIFFSLDQFYKSAFNNPVIQCAYKINYQHLLTWSVCKMH